MEQVCNLPLDIHYRAFTQVCSCTLRNPYVGTQIDFGEAISAMPVAMCQEKSPTTLSSSILNPVCEIGYDLIFNWAYAVEGGTKIDTCSCTSGNTFGASLFLRKNTVIHWEYWSISSLHMVW